MATENLRTLVIHKLSKEQYERALAAGKINPNELYLTPAEDDPDAGGGGTVDNTALEAHIADKGNRRR